jgi:HEAT repeat protein
MQELQERTLSFLKYLPSSAALCLGVSACVSGPRAAVVGAVDRGSFEEAMTAYERVRETDGADVQLLGRVAGLLLEDEARSDDRERRRDAVREIAAAGTAGDAILRRLAASGPARVDALEALARRDDGARNELRAFADDPDPDARAASMSGMHVIEDRALLVAGLAHPSARVRERAAERLAGAAPESDVRQLLEQVARVDPEAAVRVSAARALGAFGPAALDPLRERLGDAASQVRMAAVGALVRADRDAATDVLGPLLATPPSAQGIEAARLLAQPSGERPGDETARAYLRQALLTSDPALRSQAGVALVSLPRVSELEAPLREALARESDPGAKLSLARALLRQSGAREDALAALRALMREGSGMNSLQAAAVLAAERDADAAGVVAAFLDAEDPFLRRTAARALARDAMRPDDVRRMLRDPDAGVRIGAAGGMLAAASALGD